MERCIDKGNIVLIPIPFTNLKSHKKRPVIIVSSDVCNSTCEDIVVVALTSNLAPVKHSIPVESSDLEEGLLKVPSLIRADKIYTLHQGIIVKKFGKVTDAVLQDIRESIEEIMK